MENIRPCTHMAIGTHPDDIELLGMHGIQTCYEHPTYAFAGVVVADGAGSPRTGIYANVSDIEMIKIRHKEQQKAAQLGKYAVLAQLGYPSSVIKTIPEVLIQHLYDLLEAIQPHTLYLHNPLDKHASHSAVLEACIEALRRLPAEKQPKECFGVEVWRSLDFVPERLRISLPTDRIPDLSKQLIDVFESQIAGGKNYALGFVGRGLANATFSETHQVDTSKNISFAVNLLPLLHHPHLSLQSFALQLIDEFKEEVIQGFSRQPSKSSPRCS
jgi:LmbE family N-acetylglucosaminyl deacetylase